MKWLFVRWSFFLMASMSSLALAVQGVQTFTIDGKLKKSGTQTALLDPNVKLEIQIIDPAAKCLLYYEVQFANTATSAGYLNIQVGSGLGDAKRAAGDPGLTMNQIFSNAAPMPAIDLPGQTCPLGMYTPSAKDARLFRLTVTPSITGVPDTLADTRFDAVPAAMVAESADTIQGFGPAQLLRVNTAGAEVLSQVNLENVFTNSNYNTLLALLNGTSALYNKPAANGTTVLPTIAAPATPSAGQIWYSGGQIKYFDGAVTQTVTTGSGSQWTTSGANIYYSTGNVGVGTATPAYKVDIAGNAAVGASGAGGIMAFRRPDDGSVQASVGYGNGGTSITEFAIRNVGAAGTIAFYTNNGAVAERMKLDNAGNLGVGVVAPARILHVAGPMRINPAALPVAPAAGDLAFDSADTNKLKYYDGVTWQTVGTGSSVSSFNSRTGAVVPAANDYTWAQIDKTTSSLADLATRSASDLSSGTLADARLSANVPLKNGTNAFTGANSFGATTTMTVATATSEGLVIKSSDNGVVKNIVEIRDSTNAVKASLRADGVPTAATDLTTKSYVDTAISGIPAGVTSYNARTGAVVPAANDYTWNQIDKTVSSFADITTRSATDISSGTLADARLTTNVVLKNAANTFSVGGQQINNSVAATKPLVIKAAASQTATLTDWQNNAGTTLYGLDATGVPVATTDITTKAYVDGLIAAVTAASGVSSFNSRTGAVVPAANDYTWAQINKTTSSIADLTTRDAGDLSSGTLLDARLSSNVPLKNTANAFTDANTVTVPTTTKTAIVAKSSDDNNTKNILEVQNAAGTVKASIRPDGVPTAATDLTTKTYVDTKVATDIAAIPLSNYVLKAGDAMTGTLATSGSVRVGDGGEACAGAFSGGIRYNGGNLQYCNGTVWTTLGVAGAGISALTGDVTASGSGSVAATIAADAVTFAKMQNINTAKIVGRTTAAAGDPEEIGVSSNLALSAGTLDVGSNVVLKNAANTFSVGGQQITNTAAATKPLILKAAAGQTATLTDWQNSSGTTLYGLDATGVPVATTDITTKAYVDGLIAAVTATSGVTSFKARTGAVVPAANDYTWAQIDKTTSSIADLTTRSAADLSSGTLPDARLSTNVPLKNTANAFTDANTITVPTTTKTAIVAKSSDDNNSKNIFEVQNNAGTVKASIRPDGVPTATTDLTTKTYVDTAVAAVPVGNYVLKAGDTMTGALNLPANGLVTGTNQLVVSGGLVGVGTASPSGQLQVVSGAAGTVGLQVKAAAAATANVVDVTDAANAPLFSVHRTNGTTVNGLLVLGSGTTDGMIIGSAPGTNKTIQSYGSKPLELNPAGNNVLLATGGGNVGVGTTTPGTKLEVAGTVRVGDGGETCGATYTGGIRYNGGNLQFCNGTSWTTLGVAGSGITALTGDVTATGTGSVASTIAADAVTFAKMQNINTAKIVGRTTAAAGDPEEIGVSSNLALSAGTLDVGSNVVLKNAANTFSIGGQQINNSVAATKPLVIKAAASQTATLTDWQNSAGTTLYGLDATGVPVATTDLTTKSYVDGLITAVSATSGVTSFNARTGAVVPATNDYTWAQINKTTSSLADLTTRSAADLSSGTLPDARLSTNVPLKNTANAFTDANTITVPTTTKTAIVAKSSDDNNTKNILEVQNAAGTVKASIRPDGVPTAATDLTTKNYVDTAIAASPSGDILNGGNTTGAEVTIGTNDAQKLSFETGNAKAMTIDSAGNVGVGTTSPLFPFDVRNTQTSTNISKGILYLAVDGWGSSHTVESPNLTKLTVNPSAAETAWLERSAVVGWVDQPSSNSFTGRSQTGVTGVSTVRNITGTASSIWAKGLDGRVFKDTDATEATGVHAAVDSTAGAGSLIALYGETTQSGGNATSNTGVASYPVARGGTTTDLIAMDVSGSVQGGAVTNMYGIYLRNGVYSGTAVNRYGIYMPNPVGAASGYDYAMYSASTRPSYFASNIGIGTTAPGVKLEVAGTVRVGDGGETCGAAYTGGIRYNGGNLQFCNGTSWTTLGVAGSGITALTGDVTATGTGSVAATIANDAVSFAKMQNINTAKIVGRTTAAAGDPEEIGVSSNLALSAGTLDTGVNVPLKNTLNAFTDKNTITVATTTKEALVLKSSDDNTTKNVFETQNAAGAVKTSINATGVPTATTDLTTKSYVDTAAGNYVLKAGDTMTGALTVPGNGLIVTPAALAGTTAGTLAIDSGASNALKYFDGTVWKTVFTGTAGVGDFLKDGSVAMTGAFKAIGGTSAAPGVSFSGDSDTGMYSSTANVLSFATGGTTRFQLNSVGATFMVPPLISSSVVAPYTDNSAVVNAPGSGSYATIENQQNADNNFAIVKFRTINSAANTQMSYIGQYATPGSPTPTIVIGQSTGASAYTERMRIDGSGNAGIGTLAPATKLDVAGTVRVGDGGETCGATYTGGIRYNTGNLQFCNGTSWTTLGVAGSGITALTGDVTATGTGSVAATIAADAVTFAKMQNINTAKIVGRTTAAAGDPEEIGVSSNLALSGLTLDVGSNVVLKNAANTFSVGGQQINNSVAATKPLVLKAAAGQTASLTDWQNSAGTTLYGLDATGVPVATTDITTKAYVDGLIAAVTATSGVTSFKARTGAVVPAANDYTWAQIDKTTSSIADLTTRSAADLSSGTLLDARLSTNVPLKNTANAFTDANTITVPTTTKTAIVAKSSDDNNTKNILEVQNAAGTVKASIRPDGVPTATTDLTTKTYVDTKVATDIAAIPLSNYVLKAGDTMTGPLVNNSNSASTALAVTQAGAGYAASFMGGNVGIGITNPTFTLSVAGGASTTNVATTYSSAGGNPVSNQKSTLVTVTGSGAGMYIGSYETLSFSAASPYTQTNATGTQVNVSSPANLTLTNEIAAAFGASVSGPVTNATGVSAGASRNAAAGATTNMKGADFYATNSNSTATNTYGVYAASTANTSGTITNSHGIYATTAVTAAATTGSAYGGRFAVTSAGTLTNGYGVYIDDTAGTNQYGLFQVGTNDMNYFGGNTGIGTSTPGVKLEVAGTVRVGDGGETCGASYTGGIRYNGGNLQFCNGTSWATLGVAGSGITALTGDVTATGTGSVAATIANDAVTFAKMQNINTAKIVGRTTAAAGDPEEIGVSTNLALSAGTLDTGANVPLKNTANAFTDKNTVMVATTTKEALVLKSSDDNLTKHIFEAQNAAGTVKAGIAADGVPVAATDLTTKSYVDTATGNYVLKAGDSMSGLLTLPANGLKITTGALSGAATTGMLAIDSGAGNSLKYYNGTAWVAGGADNLGNHTATQNIALGNNWISNTGGNTGIRLDATGYYMGLGTTPQAGFAFYGLAKVHGEDSGNGNAVEGISTGSSGIGVYGSASNTNAVGAQGSATGANSVGLKGYTNIASSVPLEAQSEIDTATVQNVMSLYRRSTTVSSGLGGRINMQTSGFTANSRPSSAAITYGWEGAQTNDTTDRDGYLAFSTTLDNGSSATGGTERMRISSAGNVGIGTTAPAGVLHVSNSGQTNPTAAAFSVDTHPTGVTGSATASSISGIYDSATSSTGSMIGQSTSMITGNGWSGTYFYGASNILNMGNTGGIANEVVGNVNNITVSAASGNFVSTYGTKNLMNLTGGATVTNAYGNYVGVTKSAGTITNAYGVYISPIAGTNHWGLYQSGASDPNYFAGNVGIGTSTPGTKLEVAGTIRVGDGAETCGASYTGGIRYNGGNLQFCNGTSWATLGVAGSAITALTGDVTATGTGSVAATIAADAVTFAKMQNINTAKIVGRTTAAAGDPEEIAISSNLSLSALTLDVGSNVPLKNAANTFSVGGQLITNNAVGTKPLVIRGIASQTAPMQEWQNSASTVLYGLDISGVPVATTDLVTKSYADAADGNRVLKAGDTMTGQLVVPANGLKISAGALSGSATTGMLAIDSGAGNALKYYNGTAWIAPGSGAGDIINGGNTTGAEVSIGTNDAQKLNFRTNGAKAMTIDTAGNVGIGTTSPSSKLTVAGGDALINGVTVGVGAGTNTYNTIVGASALAANTTGNSNIAVGNQALLSNTTGTSSVAVGNNTLVFATTQQNNTAVGYVAGQRITGNQNTVFGSGAMGTGVANSTGWSNTAIGYYSMFNASTGGANVAVGPLSGVDLTTGSNNIILGSYSSGPGVTTGSNNVLVGNDVRAPSVTGSNQLNIGNLIYATGLSSAATASTGNVGIGTTNPGATLDVNGTVRGTTLNSSGSLYVQNTADIRGWDGTNYAPTGAGTAPPGIAITTTNDIIGTIGNFDGVAFNSRNASATYQRSFIGSAANAAGSTPTMIFGQQTGANAYAERMRIDVSGNVGIGTTTPGVKLEVAGTIRVGDGAETCGASYTGGIRYNGGNLQFCNGTAWTTLGSGGSGITTLTGDVTATGTGSVAATIANDAVTFAKMQNINTAKIVGRTTAAAGDPEEIAISSNLSLSALTLDVGSNVPLKNAANTFSVGGQLITNNAAATVPLIVRGVASQTAKLQTWQDSASTVLYGLDISGVPTATTDLPTKSYVDTSVGNYVLKSGDTMTGALVNNTNSASAALAVTQAGSGYAATFMGGNVGIGTTTPSYILDIRGSFGTGDSTAITNTNAAGNTSLALLNSSGDKLSFGKTGSTYGAYKIISARDATFYNGGAGDMAFLNDVATGGFKFAAGGRSTPDMVLNSSGNVGIGTITPIVTPTAGRGYLSVKGSSSIGVLELGSAAADADATYVGQATFSDSNSVAADKRIAIVGAYTSGTTANNRGGALVLATKADGASGLTTRMVISPSGNVGIGTATPPTDRLSINGPNFTATSGGAVIGAFTTDSAAIDVGAQLSLGGSVGGNTFPFGAISGRKENGTLNDNAGYLSFITRPSSGVQTEKMRIDSSGNVGIGTTAPGALLHVNGPMRLQPAALPGTPGAGDIAIDLGASNALKYYDGSGWKTVATGNTLTGTTTTNLTFFGIGAGGSQTLAGSTYIGKDSGLNATGASGLGSNTAIGVSTLKSENTGFNVAIGANALTANTTNYNTAVGTNSMSGASSSGNYNAALGATTMTANTTGSYNVAVGVSAMNSNTTGSYNTALGKSALDALNTGGYNTAVGLNAGNIVTSGTYNTIVGTSSAAALTTGTNNIVIGYNANVPASNTGNFMNIGNLIFGTGMTGSIAAPAGNVGIGTTTPRGKLDVAGTILNGAATSNGTVTADFSLNNIQFTTLSCGSTFALHNLKDGGSYTFVVKGTTAATCAFNAYSDAGVTLLTSHLPPDNAITISGKHTVYTFFVAGTDVYYAWTPGM